MLSTWCMFLLIISGSQVKEKLHPDYIPSLFPYNQNTNRAGTEKLKRFMNARKREAAGPVQTKGAKRKRAPAAPEDPLPVPAEKAPSPQILHPSAMQHSPILTDLDTIDMAIEMGNLRNERDEARMERDAARQNWSRERLSAAALRDSDTACKTMTGLTWSVFSTLFSYLIQFVKSPNSKLYKLPAEDQLVICLIKLRLNPHITFLSHVLGVGQSTVRSIFQRWLNLLHSKIGFLVHWPDR